MKGYWRILKMGDKIMPFAVGTVDINTGFHYPPSDGHPYLTSDQLPAALERARRPRQLFPWQEPRPAPSHNKEKGE